MTQLPKAYSYIRFSTPEQIKGDSLRRQLEATREYALTKGFELDESLTMQDMGLSAFSGAHKTKGALGSFLKATEAGKVPAGSLLIVESLDRLSRQEILSALNLFTSIIERGITIVTLIDGEEYSKETLNSNAGKLIISITIMSRAHEESVTKSKRLASAWENKRKNASKTKLTHKCPNWLRLNKKTNTFEPIINKVEVVQRIFSDYLKGNGVYVITRQLNEEGIPPFGQSKRWGKSSVSKILHNKSVLGEYQPHRLVTDGGKKTRVPEGKPIKNYYPRIIDDESFYVTQKRLSEKCGKGGRVGFVRSLFQHIAYCGVCGKKMVYRNKGQWQYLRCGDSEVSRGCTSTPWPYLDFESIFLNECRELDVSNILSDGRGQADKIEEAGKVVEACEGGLLEINQKIGNYEKAIEKASSEAVIDHFVKKMGDAMSEKTEVEKRLHEATIALNAVKSETISTAEHLKALRCLIGKLNSIEGQERIRLRDNLKKAIKEVVERIDVFPDGMQKYSIAGEWGNNFISSVHAEVEHFQNIGYDSDIFQNKAEYNRKLMALKSSAARHVKANTGKEHRAFVIWFKTGGYRLIKMDGNKRTNIVSTWEAFEEMISQGGLNDADRS